MKLIGKENLKLVFTYLIITLCFSFSMSKNLLEEMSSISMEGESELTKLEFGQIYQSVPLPKGLADMILAYTFIYPDDKVKYITLDSITVENGDLIIYRPTPEGEMIRVLLSMNEFSWLCGKSLLCKPDEAVEKLNPNGKINKTDFKDTVSQIYKKLGPHGTNCIADEYNFGIIQKAVVLCFTNGNKEKEFNNLLSSLTKKELESNALTPLDTAKDETHLLVFSDGRDAIVEKEVTFKSEGLYEKDKLLLRYGEIESIDDEKCQIKYRLPVAPVNFIQKKIFNRNCIARIRYNRLDTYIGSHTANCEEVMKYMISKIKGSCLQAKNGNNSVLVNALKSNPTEAQWKGFIFYHKLLEEKNEVNKLLSQLVISPDKISILDKDGHEARVIDLASLLWICNNDGACTIPEYKRHLVRVNKKIDYFDKLVKDMETQWNIQDTNSCFVLNEEQTHIICPTDNSEELNMRLALSIGVDKLYYSSAVSIVKPAPLDSSFKIVWVTESDTTFKDYEVLVTSEGLKNKEDKTNLLDYNDIEKIDGIKCAFVIRQFTLPNSLHEYNSKCCARFKTKEDVTFCIQKKSKCEIELRKLVQTMNQSCLKVSKAEQAAQGIPASKDDEPQKSAKDINITSFKGQVIYTPLGNHKYKGSSKSFTGTIEINSSRVLLATDNTPHMQFPIVSIRLLCKGEFICNAEGYLRNQKGYLNAHEKDWIENHFTTFFNSNKGVKKNNCSVIVVTNAEFNISEGVIVCSPENKGEEIRAAITACNDEALSKLQDDHPLLKQVPIAPFKSSFMVEMVSAAKSDDITKAQSTKTKILNLINSIRYANINEAIIDFKEIYDPASFKINTIYSLDNNSIAPSLLLKKIEPKCCFKAESTANVMFICLLSKKRCVHDKASLYMSMMFGIKKIVDDEKKSHEIKKMIQKEKESVISKNELDPFRFGLKIHYRQFPENFSLITLAADTVFNIESGKFQGWMYANDLTSRNVNDPVSPSHITLLAGKIELRTNPDGAPYETFYVHQFDSACSKPCKPKDYVKEISKGKHIADKIFLEKTITNVMGQIFKPFNEDACTVADFKEPRIGYGSSWIFCTIDDLQGEKFRNALTQSIYESFKVIHIENEVRNISWEIDKFYGVLVENDSINTKFNEFILTQKGLVGSKQGNVEKYNIDFDKIREDNFGHICAFWYKNLKINERGQDYQDAIKDNNCCFRFYYGAERKKIEICAFEPGDGVCVKKSRELMKGLKKGCILNNATFPTDEKKKKVDEYSEDTFDDNQNGIFKGFIHASDIFKPNLIPNTKPQYIKVGKKGILIYGSIDETDPEAKIELSDLAFNCDGYSPCSPKAFLSYAGTNKDYIPNLAAVSGVYNNFKTALPAIVKTFEDDCFGLETKKQTLFICPHIPAHAASLKKAIVNAYSLSYSCKTLNDVENSKTGEIFNLIIKGEGEKVTVTGKVTNKGLINSKDNTVIFNYLQMGADPVSRKKCAIWFKDVDIPFEFERKECCFNLLINSKNMVICLDEKKNLRPSCLLFNEINSKWLFIWNA